MTPPSGYRQVGWYCPGGHLNDKGEQVGESIRLDDPCAFGVPVFILSPADARSEAS